MQKKVSLRDVPSTAGKTLFFQILCVFMILLCLFAFLRARDARGTYRSYYEITEDGTRLSGGETEITLKSDGVAIMTFDSDSDSAAVHGRWSKSGSEITVVWEGGLGRITYEWSPRSLVYDPPGKAIEKYERVSH